MFALYVFIGVTAHSHNGPQNSHVMYMDGDVAKSTDGKRESYEERRSSLSLPNEGHDGDLKVTELFGDRAERTQKKRHEKTDRVTRRMNRDAAKVDAAELNDARQTGFAEESSDSRVIASVETEASERTASIQPGTEPEIAKYAEFTGDEHKSIDDGQSSYVEAEKNMSRRAAGFKAERSC